REIALFTRFAAVFNNGYARYLELRRGEIARAAGVIRNEVSAMKQSTDIVDVVTSLAEQFKSLDVKFVTASIGIIDEVTNIVRLYCMAHKIMRENFLSLPEVIELNKKELNQLIEIEGPAIVVELTENWDFYYTTEDLVGSPVLEEKGKEARVINRSDADLKLALERYQQRWSKDWKEEGIPRYVLRGPFSGGSIAVTSKEQPYTSKDVEVLEAFAEAISLGFQRFLDFRRLEEQNKVLKAATRLKSEFLANISHELRTPMNSILNFSSLVMDGIYGEVSSDIFDAVGEIERNGRNLNLLINDLLELSKIEAGAISLEWADCSPASFIETAISLVQHLAEDKGLELVDETREPLPVIRADERRITQQVLVNLLKNGVKFTETGQIRIGAEKTEEGVMFWVSDDGIGIPTTENERIFETFTQVDGSSSKVAEGTGLGLAIAKSFVELHGGRIWVESELGRGSTFRFNLPLRKG
ncbi:MAG: HAMP domain-containing sensor histidine kinase, partial [Verrucomicrobia bacterium]|nr:HAMP domain-containing sensor histidine kinase [Verrucomicrobiota bacterium]